MHCYVFNNISGKMMFSGDGNGVILLWQTSIEKKKKNGKQSADLIPIFLRRFTLIFTFFNFEGK